MWKIGHTKKHAHTNAVGNIELLGWPYKPEQEIIFMEGEQAVPIYLPGFDIKAPFEGRVLSPDEFETIIDRSTVLEHEDQMQANEEWQEHYFEGGASHYYEK